MKYLKFYLLFFASAVLLAIASCNKPDIVEPEKEEDDNKTEQEAPDTTAKEDSLKPEVPQEPEEPVVPVGTFRFSAPYEEMLVSRSGSQSVWAPGDAMNVFTIVGGRHDDAELWTNHGKFVFDHETGESFVGDLTAELTEGTDYLWHVVYPYTAEFTDPSGLEDPKEDQVIVLGHMPDSYLTQNGNNNLAHLSGPTLPLFGKTTTNGKDVPQFQMNHMAAVVAVNVKNGTSAPLTVSELKFAHSSEALVGTFAVDFGWAGAHPSSNLYRAPMQASKEACLKVVGGSPIPVNGTATFYLPVMPNKFTAGSEFIVTIGDFIKATVLTEDKVICAGMVEDYDVTVVDMAQIGLLSPANGASMDLTATDDRIEFTWEAVAGVEEYTVLFSASEDMSDYFMFHTVGNRLSLKAENFDHLVHNVGIYPNESGKAYWSVVVKGDYRVGNDVRSFNVKRRPTLPYEDRVAETITIPIAILVEDPVYNGRMEEYRGKRITEIKHEGWGYKWNDPYVQMKEFERDMEFSSNGVVEYEVVKIIQAERLFSYYRDTYGQEKEYMSVDTLVNYYFHKNPPSDLGGKEIDHAAYYDYVGMMQYYGFDKMVDAGEIKEVWVYTHPASGMNESRLIGDGAFWCNSVGIGAGEATNKELCCVMFCNYERTTDLAMHSFGHRIESIVSQVYEPWESGWNYKTKNKLSELTNWEKFSAHSQEYKKYKDGYAHVGCCHWPANAEYDYDYYNKNYVTTYADTWYDYPDIREDESVTRRINNSEWKDAGGDQWGYMKWYFGHVPHFKGICPRDLHLNNWWYYIVDYNNALEYEKQLRENM